MRGGLAGQRASLSDLRIDHFDVIPADDAVDLGHRPSRVELPTLSEIQAERCRRSFRYFIRSAWRHVVKDHDFIDGYVVDVLADHLVWLYKLEYRDLLINIAPRHTKSTICSVLFPAWIWLQEPRFQFLTSSFTYTLAKRDANKMRKLTETEWYRAIARHPDGRPLFQFVDRGNHDLKRLKDTETFFENSQGGNRRAVGAGGAVGEGGDMMSVDDPINPEGARSEADRDRVNRWWVETMSTRGSSSKSRSLIVMQRLDVKDLTGYVLERMPRRYVHLSLPVRFNPKRICVTRGLGGRELYRDRRTEPGELLWKERFDASEVERIAEMLGPEAAAAQLDQSPVPPGGVVFKSEWLRRWSPIDLPRAFEKEWSSWDLNAGEETRSGSFVVGVRFGLFKGRIYILDLVRGRWEFVETEQQFFTFHYRKSMGMKLIEKKAAGASLISKLKGVVPGVWPITPHGSKLERARAVTPFFRTGDVLLPPDGYAPWVGPYVDEMLRFPSAPHDDQVDATTQGLAFELLPREGVESDAEILAAANALSS